MNLKILAAFLLATSLLLASCGGGDDDGDGTPAPSPTATTPAVTDSTPAGPTATPGPPLDGSLFPVLNHLSFRSSTGLYFIGEIRNDSGVDAYAVITTVTLTDAGGQVLGSGRDGLQAKPYFPAGETMAFKMPISNAPQDWATETITVEAREATGDDIARAYTAFEIQGAMVVQANQGLTVSGALINNGEKAAEPIKLMFIARDAEGNVIGAWGANPAQGLQPGQNAPFAFPVLDVPEVPPTYELTAYALE